MKKNEPQIKGINVLADGTVMTDEEFMSKPFVVEEEKNPEVFHDMMMILSPEYKARELAKRRVRKREAARRRNQEQEAAILNALGET